MRASEHRLRPPTTDCRLESAIADSLPLRPDPTFLPRRVEVPLVSLPLSRLVLRIERLSKPSVFVRQEVTSTTTCRQGGSRY